MARKKRTREELKEAWKHFDYEFGMLDLVTRGLESGVAGRSAIHNALVESYAIHLRNLIEFVWPQGKPPKKDFVIADDFLDSPADWPRDPIPVELKVARVRAAQEVAHLMYARLRRTPESKRWDFLLATRVLDLCRDFAAHIPAELRTFLMTPD